MNFLLTLLFASTVSYAEDLEHLRAAHWENRVPDVVICNGSNINTDLVERAVQSWEERGENIGRITRKSCGSRLSSGEIGVYITNDLRYSTSEGETIRNVYNDHDGSPSNRIHHARIYIRPQNVDSFILIEHELGHALGFDDTHARGSIMSKNGPIY